MDLPANKHVGVKYRGLGHIEGITHLNAAVVLNRPGLLET